MKSVTLECIGGPWDGQIVAIPEGDWEFRIALFDMPKISEKAEGDLLAPLPRVGAYRRRVDGDRQFLEWEGEL